MTPRPHTLAPSLGVPVAAPNKSPSDNAPFKADTSPAASESASAKGATDIVASCEDKSASGASNVGEAIPPGSEKGSAQASALQVAIDRCKAVRNRPGSFLSWGERSEETAAAALDLVALMTKDNEALEAVRKTVNEERKNRGERALNKSTSQELLAVFLCAPPSTKAERQECSRFANVISAAADEKRTSGNVGAWLKATTLSEALEKAALCKGKVSNKNYSVAITRNKYPQLWENFKSPEVRNAIEKALTDLNKSLTEEAPANEPLPVQELPANE